jgi:phosphoesterase RecJ-like protein
MRKAVQAAATALARAKSIALACHVNPDGDTLGCILALGHALKALEKDVTLLSTDGVPDILRWMPGADWILTRSERRDFDVAVVCDAGALDRVGRSVLPIVESAPVLIDIDHHVTEEMVFGNIRILDPKAAATAELVWLLIRALEKQSQPLTNEAIALCLMTALVTDTGSFRYRNVRPQTFRLAATLQQLGAHPAPIDELVFENRSFASIKLLGRALDSMQVTSDGSIAWARVTARDFEELGATDADTEGIVSHVRAVKEVRVGILFREIPGNKVRLSLRAREGADVNKIANVFGGGGHRLAAGCSLEPPLEEVERVVLAEAARQLANPLTG